MKNSEIAAARVQVALAKMDKTTVDDWVAELASREFSVESEQAEAPAVETRTAQTPDRSGIIKYTHGHGSAFFNAGAISPFILVDGSREPFREWVHGGIGSHNWVARDLTEKAHAGSGLTDSGTDVDVEPSKRFMRP
ncbi:hypothetical protein [Plantibacter sp. YIM 135249]|uniref:hypothetical protein n=1 Tax=Plantibacter sp. YIM 135249 TaxID=3423918 RepID=UPI003D3313D2